VNDSDPQYFRSANEPTPRARPSCQGAEHCGGQPDVPRVSDGGAPLASPSAKSLVIPMVSLPVQSAAPGDRPVIGITQHAGSAKPRTPARLRWFKRWRLSDIRRRLGLPGHISREDCRELRSDSENWIQGTLAGGIGGLHKAGGWVVRVTWIITRLSPWSRTGTIRSGWRSRAGFVNRRRYSAVRIARSDDAGHGESGRRWLTAVGASRRRFPLTGRSRRDSIRGTGRYWPDEQPAQVLVTPARA
jgi:hypothetical protein